MKYWIIITSLLIGATLTAQITITTATIPEIGDELEYTTFANYQDTTSYRASGEDMTWSFDNIVGVATNTESYFDISGNALADTFPEANMLLEFGGFESAAVRTDSSISLIGVIVNDITGLGVEANVNLEEGFKLRQAPFNFGDKIEDAFTVVLGIDATVIPGLDSLDLGFPGAELDSIRVTTDISKTEEATGWGTVNILGNSIDALQIRQNDITTTTIELGILLFGNRLWLNAADILGSMVDDFGGNQSSTTYKYMSADNKRSIVEFNENTVVTDTLGNTMLVINGRTSAELLTNTEELSIDNRKLIYYPNPATDYLYVTTNVIAPEDEIYLYNMQGQQVLSVQPTSDTNRLDIQHIQSGTYTLHYKTLKETIAKKIVILR